MELQIPNKPYADWSRFLSAVWTHGMSKGNYEPKEAEYHCWRAGKSASQSLTRDDQKPVIRPSAFIACSRQTWFMRQGYEPQPMPDNIGLTFAMGHVLHEVSYGAVKSALPDCFSVEFEVEVPLPSWWPESDEPWINRKGHIDCVIKVDNPTEAAAYLPVNGDRVVLVDFKSMGGFSFRNHKKKDYSSAADGFGYLSQLAVYADIIEPDVVLLAGINRDQLTAPLCCRRIDNSILAKEVTRVQNALGCEEDPGPEMLTRWDKEAHFYCGGGSRAGYCPFRDRCHATHSITV